MCHQHTLTYCFQVKSQPIATKKPKTEVREDTAEKIMSIGIARYRDWHLFLFSLIDFGVHPNAVSQSVSQGLVRFHAPPPNWGPLPRARASS